MISLAQSQALVHVSRADVSTAEEAAACIRMGGSAGLQLHGIVHAAGLQVQLVSLHPADSSY